MIPIKKRRGLALLVSALSLTTIVAVSGTLAWYQVHVHADVEYNGTSVGNSTKFQIGLKSSATLTNYESYNFTRDTTDTSIYWANGDLSSDAIMYYLESNGYATNVLNCVTAAGCYDTDVDLTTSPSYLDNTKTSASSSYYIRLNFVFRIINMNTGGLITNKDIFISDAILDGEGNAYKCLRMYYVGNDSSSGLVNLSEDYDGNDVYGGPLDLNTDGYYDYISDVDTGGSIVSNEFAYGYYSGTPSYGELVTTDPGPSTSGSTFVGNHHKDVYPIASGSYSSSDYIGRNTLCENETVLTSIGNTGYATLDTYLFLEGWDKNCINNIMGDRFGLVMTFESK
ncbi:MAG: hypothetical protein WCR97_05070 [Bacilli bacterium]